MVLTPHLLIKPNEKQIKLMAVMESDSETENGDIPSDELLHYKMEMKVPESINPLQWWKLNSIAPEGLLPNPFHIPDKREATSLSF